MTESRAMRFENLRRPPANTPLSEMEVEGVKLDLHQKLRLVGLTYGIEPTSTTLGWAVAMDVHVVRQGRALPLSGLALHFIGVSRFEVALQADSPGAMEYFEVRRDPEWTIVFFFEGGTIRISADECKAELVVEPLSGSTMVQ